MTNRAMRLGKKPFPITRRRQLAAHMARHQALMLDLQQPPASADWQQNLENWGMLGNDQYGDCTVAAACHAIMCWTLNVQGQPAAIDELEARQAFQLINPRFVYNPEAPSNSVGGKSVFLQDTIHWWYEHGIAGRKIDAYGLLPFQNLDSVKRAIAYFGACCIGIQLPSDEADPDHPDAAIGSSDWDVATSTLTGPGTDADPNLGHCVLGIAYDAEGLNVVTWGAVKRMSWDFLNKYMDEAFVMLSLNDWVAPNGEAPSGLNADQLKAHGPKLCPNWVS